MEDMEIRVATKPCVLVQLFHEFMADPMLHPWGEFGRNLSSFQFYMVDPHYLNYEFLVQNYSAQETVF